MTSADKQASNFNPASPLDCVDFETNLVLKLDTLGGRSLPLNGQDKRETASHRDISSLN